MLADSLIQRWMPPAVAAPLALLAACGSGSGLPETPSSFAGAVAEVFKYDGSVQCTTSGASVDQMARQLTSAGIDVLCGKKGSDGYAYIALCGAGTGAINVYAIHVENLADAESLGFLPVTELPDYEGEPCSP